MSRSCQSATFSSAGTTWLRTSRARPHRFSLIHGIALVRHRRAALLAARERLGGLADLGALQMADLGREALDAAGDDRERGEERGVAVARDHLGRDRLRREAEPRGDLGLDRRVDVGEGADRARDRAGRDLGARRLQAPPVARELGVEARELEAEGDRLGVHAVRAADAGRVLVLERAPAQRREQLVEAGQQQVGGLGELAGEGGVEQVGRGHAEMQIARLGADHLLDVGQERDHVVARDRLDLLDPRGIDDRRAAVARPRPGTAAAAACRHLAELGHRLERAELDLEPEPEPVLRRPDARPSAGAE